MLQCRLCQGVKFTNTHGLTAKHLTPLVERLHLRNAAYEITHVIKVLHQNNAIASVCYAYISRKDIPDIPFLIDRNNLRMRENHLTHAARLQ